MIDNKKIFEEVRVMHEAGVLADYACQEDPIPQEDAVLLARFALASLDGQNKNCDAEKMGGLLAASKCQKMGECFL